jgi:hypothetical protein
MFYVHFRGWRAGCPLHWNHQNLLRKRTVSAPIKDLLSNVVDYIFGDPIPAPEVIESDPATTWGLWEDAVKKLDELVETRRTTQPSQLQ